MFNVSLATTRELSKQFVSRDDGLVARIADNVDTLAYRFWCEYVPVHRETTTWSQSLQTMWDHLLLATANFKRQRWVDSGAIFERPPSGFVRTDAVSIRVRDSERVVLHSEPPLYRHELIALRGFVQAPTGSALLAALWPEKHLIIDRRALAAGLMAAPNGPRWLEDNYPDEHRNGNYVQPSWEDYEWFRQHAVETARDAGIRLRDLELALYVADIEVSYPGQGWPRYGARIREFLDPRNP